MLALLAPSLPWIWAAWFSSPLDAWGWVFLLLGFLWWFLVLDLDLESASPAADSERTLPALDHAGWPALAAFIALGAAGLVLDLRVAMAAAPLGIGWACAWLLLGGRLALLLLPSLVLGLLALPTMGYLLQQAWISIVGWIAPWTGALLGPGGAGVLLLKAGVALLVLLLGLGLAWLERVGRLRAPRPAAAAYVAALGFAAVGLVAALNPPVFGPSLALDEDQWAFGAWLGAEIPVSPAEQRLFADSRRLSKRLYSSRDGQRVSVLLVESDDVHELHTPEYCLSGSGWRFSRDEPLSTDNELAFGHAPPAAGALAATRGEQRLSGIYWFSSAAGSTDDLAGLRFLRRQAPGTGYSMTLVTAVGDAVQAPDAVLAGFIRDAPWVQPSP